MTANTGIKRRTREERLYETKGLDDKKLAGRNRVFNHRLKKEMAKLLNLQNSTNKPQKKQKIKDEDQATIPNQTMTEPLARDFALKAFKQKHHDV